MFQIPVGRPGTHFSVLCCWLCLRAKWLYCKDVGWGRGCLCQESSEHRVETRAEELHPWVERVWRWYVLSVCGRGCEEHCSNERDPRRIVLKVNGYERWMARGYRHGLSIRWLFPVTVLLLPKGSHFWKVWRWHLNSLAEHTKFRTSWSPLALSLAAVRPCFRILECCSTPILFHTSMFFVCGAICHECSTPLSPAQQSP